MKQQSIFPAREKRFFQIENRSVADSGQILFPIMSGDTTTDQEIFLPIQQLDPEDILGECNWMFEVENQDMEEPGQESESSEEEKTTAIDTDSHPFLWQ